MKESNKEKFVALVSRKEVVKHIKNSNDLDQGEESGEEITNELVGNTVFLLNNIKKADQMGFERVNLREAAQ